MAQDKKSDKFLIYSTCNREMYSVSFFSSKRAVFSATLFPSGVGKRKLSEILFLVRLKQALKVNAL